MQSVFCGQRLAGISALHTIWSAWKKRDDSMRWFWQRSNLDSNFSHDLSRDADMSIWATLPEVGWMKISGFVIELLFEMNVMHWFTNHRSSSLERRNLYTKNVTNWALSLLTYDWKGDESCHISLPPLPLEFVSWHTERNQSLNE